MTVMRDVDFLLAARAGDPPLLDRAVVYRYRSGVLRSRVKAVLGEIAKRHGGQGLATGKLPLRLDFAEGFFPVVKYHDWPAQTSKGLSTDTLEESLTYLAISLDRPSVHFVEHGSAVARHVGWRAVERGALVIEEPVITRESLPSVLGYLAATTDLARGADLLEQPRFVASFTGLIDERAGLHEAIQAFEERVLLCTDPVTNRYDDKAYRHVEVARLGRRTLLPHLRDLTALRRERDLIDLVCGFDERRAECGWSAYRLVSDLYRMTGELLAPVTDQHRSRSEPRSRIASHRVAEGTALWAALVLAWEDALIRSVREDEVGYRRGPDLLVSALAGLGRDFLARGDGAEAGDPLAGRWADVARSLGQCGNDIPDDPSDPFATARGRVVRALAAALARPEGERPDWFGRLHVGALAACKRLDAKMHEDEKREDNEARRRKETGKKPKAKGSGDKPQPPTLIPPPSPLHRTFASVIGRGHAVAGLRRHARERTDGVDLLLHGPDGVGKRTLAWSYARMVLCTDPSPDGSACGECMSCRDFETGHSGCIELDGEAKRIKEKTDGIVDRVQRGSVRDKRFVFVVRKADRYPPAEFDKLLKPMEDGARARFVLLARDRRDVRLAGQSRCFDYRVRPLDRTEAERFTREALAERGRACDDATLTLLLDAGGGLPGCLHKDCGTLAGMGLADLADVRMKLGLGWAEGLVARWTEIVAGAPSVLADVMRAPGPDRAEQVRRVRAVLQWVLLHGMRGASHDRGVIDPGLRHLDADTCASLAAEIDRHADREGTTAEVVWARLAETWMADRLSSG